MSEFTAVLPSNLEAGDPLTATQAQAFYTNPIAMSEVDQTVIDAGIIVPGVWYPEDGAGGIGPIWNHAIDGDTATITTPAFDVKLEYMLVFEDVTVDGTGAGSAVEIEHNLETSGYSVGVELAGETSSPYNFTMNGMAEIIMPNRQGARLFTRYHSDRQNVTGATDSNSERVLNSRLTTPVSTFTGGALFMFKRRCYF